MCIHTGELIDEMTHSLTEHVAQYLQVAIINGLLRPGELITEPEIAERLGVSRTPVREAMARLQAIGLIERTPGKYGTRVRAMSSAEAVQILQVRLILESAALEIACVTASEESLRPLRALLEIERQRIDAGELLLLKEEGWRFHEKLIALTGNKMLQELATQVNDRFSSQIVSVPPSREREELSYQDHTELVNAIARRDAKRAKEIIKHHIQRVIGAFEDSRLQSVSEGTSEYLDDIVRQIQRKTQQKRRGHSGRQMV
jgi:DNA-binding GntR family transcriptional regulator